MKILWFTWKDLDHPQSGGAEVVNEELAKRLVAAGHEVLFITSNHPSFSRPETTRHGFKIIRVGNRFTLYYKAFLLYRKLYPPKFDLVIDEINTIPFFCKFYVREKNIVFIHQLAREVWFYQISFPLNLIGYLLEPLYLRLINDRPVITVSESTKSDLIHLGFQEHKITIISEGIQFTPLDSLPSLSTKEKNPTVMFLGSIRPMKNPWAALQAFEIAKKNIPNLKFWVIGKGAGAYYRRFLNALKTSKFSTDITYFETVDSLQKLELLSKAHLIIAPSVREGWGLIVTEANALGTIAVAYNVPGLRDSVRDQLTGIVCKQNNPQNLAQNMIELLTNTIKYQKYRATAWEWSKEINFDHSCAQFLKIITSL
jgi:glycosyltransferase involved in cell wall biosynthesis